MDDRGPTAGTDTRQQRTRRRLSRAVREFAAVPLLVISAFLGLAMVSIVADQAHVAGLDAVRSAIQKVIGKQAATATLQGIATGLVTVTSITFSVLLLAVQQTASSLSPVVFDQFVRRRGNQVFLGFFVGLALFAYVVMAAVQDQTPPVLGAAIATVLTVVALACLLVLVYTTIDQMRPANVLRQIHDRALQARRREWDLIRRTRRRERSRDPVSATYHCETTGYVSGIDLQRLARALERIPDAEIWLHATQGRHVAYGDVVATVRDDDESDARWLADEVRAAIQIGPEPDLDADASTGINEIGNIAWTSASSSKQNPEVARQALDALRDLAARWIDEDPSGAHGGSAEDGRAAGDGCEAGGDGHRAAEDVLPVVYVDDDLDRILEVLYSILVAATESRQHVTAARVLETYETLLARATGRVAQRLGHDVVSARALLDEMPPSSRLRSARLRVERSAGLQPAGRPSRDGVRPDRGD
jgi:uncharacterized membrane protein